MNGVVVGLVAVAATPLLCFALWRVRDARRDARFVARAVREQDQRATEWAAMEARAELALRAAVEIVAFAEVELAMERPIEEYHGAPDQILFPDTSF